MSLNSIRSAFGYPMGRSRLERRQALTYVRPFRANLALYDESPEGLP